jgi:pimeloyl-ACP methyl ester carboxylesterase
MTTQIPFKSIQVNIQDMGQGLPIVLLHGYLLSSEAWGGFAGELAQHHRVVAIDIPGHGASGVLGETHTMEMMADAVAHVLEAMQIGKCILIGHSMGGYIALAFLGKYPDRLLAFSLFHSTPFADTDEKKANRDREIAMVREGKRETLYNVNIPKMFADDNLPDMKNEIEMAKGIAQRTKSEGIIALLEGMKSRPDQLSLLRKTEIPFLLVLGKKDNYIPYDIVSEKMGIPRNITKLILENSGHMGFVEEKEKSVLGVLRFINELKIA